MVTVESDPKEGKGFDHDDILYPKDRVSGTSTENELMYSFFLLKKINFLGKRFI